MSIAENPLVGRLKGSMANFTTYTSNGKNIVRSKPFKVRDARSVKQLLMRARMKKLASLYNSLSPIIVMGFTEDSFPKPPENLYTDSPYNLFVKANFSNAFETIENMPVTVYPMLQLSRGSLPEVTVIDAVTNTDGITIQYDAELLPEVTFAIDEIIAFAKLNNGSLLIARQIRGYDAIGTIFLKYPVQDASEVECCYLFARRWDGKKVSNSTYVKVRESVK